MGMQWYTPSKSLGNLSKGVFERRTSTGSEVFFILKHLDASKFVFLSVFIIIETICPKIWAKLPSKNEEDRFRLTCVTQKRLCLSSLLSLWRKLCGKTFTRPPELTWAIQRFPHFLSRLGKPLTWEQIVASARRMTRLSEFGLLKGRETETDHNLRARVSADAVWVAYFCSAFWLVWSVTWVFLPKVVSFLF